MMRRSVMGCHVKSMHYDYSGKLSASKCPKLCYASIPEIHSLATRVLRGQRQSEKEMKP
jgi:hypothetical protein